MITRYGTAASSGPFARRWLRRAILVLACAELLQWRFRHTITVLQRPPSARCILLALQISLCRRASFPCPNTARSCSCDERARVFTVIHPSARCSSIRRIDRQRLIIERIGATRTNQHDAHELCGHPGAQSGSAKAMTRAAWCGSGRGSIALDWRPSPPQPATCHMRFVCVRIWRVVKVPTSLGGPRPLPYTRRAKS